MTTGSATSASRSRFDWEGPLWENEGSAAATTAFAPLVVAALPAVELALEGVFVVFIVTDVEVG